MKSYLKQLILVMCTVFSFSLHAQVYKLHAEYKSDWYGQGYVMNADIPGYPSVSLQADTVADQFVIEANNGNDRWRKYGTTSYDTAHPTVWYTLGITDNYFNVPTKAGYYYTTRIKNSGYSSTNFIVMQTQYNPVDFAASNPVTQSPLSNAVANLSPVDVTVNLATVPSPEEKFFVCYSTDNFVTKKIAAVVIQVPGNTGIATIPAYVSGTAVRYYVFSSTVDATQPVLANDYDLITLKQVTNQGANYSYTVDQVYSKITFNLNMNNEIVSPNGVYLVGSFNNFDSTATPMNNMGGGYYQVAISLDTSDIIEYKYLNGNSFLDEEDVPFTCGISNGLGGYNRILEIPGSDTELDTVCFGKCYDCSSIGLVKVKFSVNMALQTVSPAGVHIAGSFNNFNASQDSLLAVGNGIYETEILLDSTSVITYKFINGNSFSTEENVPATCGISNGFGTFDRFLEIPENDILLDTVCFSSCSNCIAQVPVTIEFRVNMSNQIVSPNGVHIAGSFNGFTADSTLMSPLGGGIYFATVTVLSGTAIEYKYINGDSFLFEEQVPSTCGVANGLGGYNRSILAPSAAIILNPVCFSSCANCVSPILVNVAFRVNMNNEIVSANGVHIAGSFNNFSADSTLMNPIGGGIYEAILALDTTATITYKFINGNSFATVENVPSGCGISDGFGGYNRQLVVPNVDDTLALVCFSSCSNCTTPAYVNVTLLVDLTGLTVSPNGVHIAGTFNGFSASATPMILVGNSIYTASFYLDTTSTIEYKYINGDAFGVGLDETVPAACGVSNGFGGYNRYLNVPETDDTLNVVCFSSCAACLGIGMNETTTSDFNFTLLPSITTESTWVQYSTPTNEQVYLSVLSPDGRQIEEIVLPKNETSKRFELSTSSLNSGIYIVQLRTGKHKMQKKLAVVK